MLLPFICLLKVVADVSTSSQNRKRFNHTEVCARQHRRSRRLRRILQSLKQAASLTYTTSSGGLRRPNDVIRSSSWLLREASIRIMKEILPPATHGDSVSDSNFRAVSPILPLLSSWRASSSTRWRKLVTWLQVHVTWPWPRRRTRNETGK